MTSNKKNKLLIKISVFVTILLATIIFLTLFLIIYQIGFEKKNYSFQNKEEIKCYSLEDDYLQLVPVNPEDEETILKDYNILDIANLYGQRNKIFLNLSQKDFCPKIKNIVFVPFYGDYYETKHIFILLDHCENNLPIKIQAETTIKGSKYDLDFSIIRRGDKFSLWLTRWSPPFDEKVSRSEKNFYPINFIIKDSLGKTFEFRYFIQIF